MYKAITNFTQDEYDKMNLIVGNPLPTAPYPITAYLTTGERITTGLMQWFVGNKNIRLNEEGFHRALDSIFTTGVATTYNWVNDKGEHFCIITINDRVGIKPEKLQESIAHEVNHLVLNIFEKMKFNPLHAQEPMAYLSGLLCREATRMYYTLSTNTIMTLPKNRMNLYVDVGWDIVQQRAKEELRMRENGVVKLSDDLASWSSRSWFNV